MDSLDLYYKVKSLTSLNKTIIIQTIQQDPIIKTLLGALSVLNKEDTFIKDVLRSVDKEWSEVADLMLDRTEFNLLAYDLDSPRNSTYITNAFLNYYRHCCFLYVVLDKWVQKFSGVTYKQYRIKSIRPDLSAANLVCIDFIDSSSGKITNIGVAMTFVNGLDWETLTKIDDFCEDITLFNWGIGQVKYLTLSKLSFDNFLE